MPTTLTFGEFFKEKRIGIRKTLRQFCLDNNFDPGNINKLEQNTMAPPQNAGILERYAKALSIKKGTDAWYAFFDLAAADRGIIPQDLMSDQEVVKMLPAFFRTLRGQKPTEEEMIKLVEKIRKS